MARMASGRRQGGKGGIMEKGRTTATGAQLVPGWHACAPGKHARVPCNAESCLSALPSQAGHSASQDPRCCLSVPGTTLNKAQHITWHHQQKGGRFLEGKHVFVHISVTPREVLPILPNWHHTHVSASPVQRHCCSQKRKPLLRREGKMDGCATEQAQASDSAFQNLFIPIPAAKLGLASNVTPLDHHQVGHPS
jgi:hypothetical protein